MQIGKKRVSQTAYQRRLKTGGRGYVLAAVHRIRYGRTTMARTSLVTPDLVAAARVKRKELAVRISSKYQVTSRSQHRSQQNVFIWIAPGALTADGVPGVQVTI